MSISYRTLKLLRRHADDSHDNFLTMVETLNNFNPLTKLKYLFDGTTYKEYGTIEELGRIIFSAKTQPGMATVLSTGKSNPLFALDFFSESFEFGELDIAEFSFNVTKPLLKPGGYFSYAEFDEFFLTIVTMFKAGTAYIYDSDIMQWIEEEDKAVVSDTLDVLKIPNAIYWFNYWNKTQVRHIGEEKLKSAPFEVIRKQPDGGYALIVQKENFDIQDSSHKKKLETLYDYFDLYALQSSYIKEE